MDLTTFHRAYDRVLGQWPGDVEATDVDTSFGPTRVNACGRADSPPLILLAGGGATSTVWFANAAALGAQYRVLGVDLMGDVGRSRNHGVPVKRPADLMAWLDEVVVALGVERAHLAGHSYGGWVALRYALHAPERVARLVLLDPSQCFGRPRTQYAVRALPLLLRPGGDRMRRFLRWETRGARLDDAWLDLVAIGAQDFPAHVVMPRTPTTQQLSRLTSPVLMLLAGGGAQLDPGRVIARARRHLRDVDAMVVDDATHHTLPTEHAEAVDTALLGFLAQPSSA